MTSKNYTNLILTVIAILLAGLFFKGFSDFPLENRVFAGDEKYKEFRIKTTYIFDADRVIKENTEGGWKAISIAQSQKENDSTANLTILFAK